MLRRCVFKKKNFTRIEHMRIISPIMKCVYAFTLSRMCVCNKLHTGTSSTVNVLYQQSDTCVIDATIRIIHISRVLRTDTIKNE